MRMVVIGSVFVDLKGYPLGEYIPHGRNTGRIEEVHGGVARNIAEDLAAAGERPVFLGLVDPGAAGTGVREHLRDRGVDVSHLRTRAGGMGTWLAVFNHLGDVEASISRRPDLGPIAEILREEGEEIFSRAEALLLELDLEEEPLSLALELAEKHGVPVYAAVSVMSLALERRAYLPRTDLFVCNRQEMGQLFGESGEEPAPEELARRLSEQLAREGIPAMAVTLGERGAVWATQDGRRGCCPAVPAEVEDTTGAGDAFFAGTCLGLVRGKSLDEACRVGTRLAAAVVASRRNVAPDLDPEELGL